TTTALYLISLVLQNSASLRFLGTFISGALPEKLTTPLMVAVPNLASLLSFLGSSFFASAVCAAAVAAAAVLVLGVGLGSSGQPTPIVRARDARAATEARSRPFITMN